MSAKQRRKAQHTLVMLIRNYQEHNVADYVLPKDAQSPCIPVFIAQSFSHLIRKFKAGDHQKLIIKSELLSLGALQKETMSFSPSGVTLTPFVNSLHDASPIAFCNEFLWNMSRAQLLKLQQSPPNRCVWSDDFTLRLSRVGEVVFCMGLSRKAGGFRREHAGVVLKIKRLWVPNISGLCSVSVQEAMWTLNAFPVTRLAEGRYTGLTAFKDALLDDMQSLTMRIALYFGE